MKKSFYGKALIALLLVCACALSLMTACSSGSSSTEPAAPAADSAAPAPAADDTPAGDEVVTLNIITHVQYDFLSELWPLFEARYPNIKINWEVGQGVDSGVYAALLASDDCPDLVMLGTGAARIPPLYEAGLIEDLTDYYSERGWDQRVSQSMMDSLKIIDNGRLLEVSNGMDVFSFKYYKSEFEELNLEPPTTWDEFIDLLEALKAAGRTPIVMGAKNNVMAGHMYSAYLQAFAGADKVADLIYGDKKWTDPEPLQAAQALNDMLVNGYINKDVNALENSEASAVFANKGGSIVLLLQGYLDKYQDDGLDINDIGSFVLPSYDPSLPTAPIAGFAQCWVLPVNSKQKEAALTFMDYVTSDAYIQDLTTLGNIGGWDPGIGASVPQDPAVLEAIDHPVVRTAFEQLAAGTGYNLSPYVPGEVKTQMFEGVQKMFAGEITPEQFVQNMQTAKEQG